MPTRGRASTEFMSETGRGASPNFSAAGWTVLWLFRRRVGTVPPVQRLRVVRRELSRPSPPGAGRARPIGPSARSTPVIRAQLTVITVPAPTDPGGGAVRADRAPHGCSAVLTERRLGATEPLDVPRARRDLWSPPSNGSLFGDVLREPRDNAGRAHGSGVHWASAVGSDDQGGSRLVDGRSSARHQEAYWPTWLVKCFGPWRRWSPSRFLPAGNRPASR